MKAASILRALTSDKPQRRGSVNVEEQDGSSHLFKMRRRPKRDSAARSSLSQRGDARAASCGSSIPTKIGPILEQSSHNGVAKENNDEKVIPTSRLLFVTGRTGAVP